MTTRIAIASGSAERRAAIRKILAGLPRVEVAGEICESAALRLLAPLAPNLLLVDAATPMLNPISILQMQRHIPIIVLAATSNHNEQQYFRELGAHTVVAPDQFESLCSVISAMIGEPTMCNGQPRPAQPRRGHWTRHVMGMLTHH